MNPARAREELGDGCIGMIMALVSVPDPLVVQLHKFAIERGSALWERFTTWRDAQTVIHERPFAAWAMAVYLGSAPYKKTA